MALTPKMEGFCLAYIESGKASDSYRKFYSTKNMKPETVHENACRLLKNSKVAARIAEIRKPAADKAGVTLEQHLIDLKRLRDLAEASEKYGPAVTAEMARGKASGLYVDKIDLNVTDALAERLARAKGRK